MVIPNKRCSEQAGHLDLEKTMKHQCEPPSSHWLTSLTQCAEKLRTPEGQKWKHMKTCLEPTHLWAWSTGYQSNHCLAKFLLTSSDPHLTASPVVNVLHLDGASANVWLRQCPWLSTSERHDFYRHSKGHVSYRFPALITWCNSSKDQTKQNPLEYKPGSIHRRTAMAFTSKSLRLLGSLHWTALALSAHRLHWCVFAPQDDSYASTANPHLLDKRKENRIGDLVIGRFHWLLGLSISECSWLKPTQDNKWRSNLSACRICLH